MKPASPRVSVSYFSDRCALYYSDLGEVRPVTDAKDCHYLEEIAAKLSAYPRLVEALRFMATGEPSAHDCSERAMQLLRELGEAK